MSYAVPGPHGSVTVSEGALAQIVVQAAEAVEGARVRRQRRHLDIAVADGHARVALELAVAYGSIVPEVARAVQEQVAEALRAMCAVEVDAVDVAIEELEH